MINAFELIIKIFRIIAIIFMVIFVVFGIYSYIQELKFVNNSIETEGVIIDYVSKFGSLARPQPSGTYAVCSIIQYEAHEQKVNFTSGVCKDYKLTERNIGEKVTVLYDQNNPEKAREKTTLSLYANSISSLIMFGIAALIFIIARFFQKFAIKTR